MLTRIVLKMAAVNFAIMRMISVRIRMINVIVRMVIVIMSVRITSD